MADYVCSKNEILKTYINPFTLPWCHLKTTNKGAKFETLKSFSLFFFFLHRLLKGFLSKRTALKVDVIGAENILFAGASVHLSARKFYMLGQVKGLILY